MNDQYLLEHMEAIPLDGEGTVVRRPGLVAVFAGDPSDVADLLTEFDASSPKGLALIEELRDLDGLEVAAVVDTPMGVQLVLTGAMHALIDEGDPDDPGLEVRTPAGGTVTDLDDRSASVWIGTAGIRNVLRHSVFNLEAGTVPGGGILLRPIPSAAAIDTPAAATLIPPPIVDEPAVVLPFESIELKPTAPPARQSLPIVAAATPEAIPAPAPTEVETSTPTPSERSTADDQVRGIRCSRDHFNNPSAAYCQVCGISMIHLTHRLVPGPRPTLGFIVFDDGATFALDRAYRLGRQPDPVANAETIAIIDSEHSLSRHHADLSFDEWSVVLTDRGSTNGTFLWDESAGRWNRLAAGVPTVLPTGAHVALGRRTFTYESATRS